MIKLPINTRSPLFITLAYLVSSLLWIAVSDHFLEILIRDSGLRITFQTFKGWFFVMVTALMLYFLVERATRKLEQSQSSLNLALESAGMATWSLDPDTGRIHGSVDYHHLFGYETASEEWTIETFLSRIHPEDRQRVDNYLHKTIEQQTGCSEEFRTIWPDGSVHWLWSQGKLETIARIKSKRLSGVLLDITPTKETERKLKESEAKYRHMFEHSPLPMWIFDPETLQFIEVNDAAVQHYGYTRDEFLAMTVNDIRPEEDAEALKRDIGSHRGTNSYGEEWTHLKKDGTPVTVEISAADIDYEGKKYRLILASDITLQKKAKEQIISSIIEGEDRERQRIAHELHDGLGQYLVAANMNFESLKPALENLPEKRMQQFETGFNLLRHALAEIRSISRNLMPRVIEDYGLIMALETLIENVKKSSDINMLFFHNLSGTELLPQIEMNLYRIVQESISNAVKYARCSKIIVQLFRHETSLVCTVEDNGIGGFNPKAKETGGLGIRSMKTRADAMAGSINFDSRKGKGTHISVEIPFPQKNLS